eukprot:scaffold268_cov236-Pinguiococcus_pyrenoidosus.AAC.17
MPAPPQRFPSPPTKASPTRTPKPTSKWRGKAEPGIPRHSQVGTAQARRERADAHPGASGSWLRQRAYRAQAYAVAKKEGLLGIRNAAPRSILRLLTEHRLLPANRGDLRFDDKVWVAVGWQENRGERDMTHNAAQL